MKKQTLALCMIVKPEDLKQSSDAIESVKQYVDKIYLTVTGEPPWILEDGDKICYSRFDWNDDFAAARAFNFSQVKEDWILWLDADDTLLGAEHLKDLIQEEGISGYAFKYRYSFDSNGNCTEEHWKTQLLKNDGHFKWLGAIHEDPIQQRPVNWSKSYACTRVHNSNESRSKESHERNLRILLKEIEKNPNEPRTYFYLGKSYLATGKLDAGIEMLQKYLSLSGWDDERYEASILIGIALLEAGQIDDALSAFNQSILEKEVNPDAYIQKGLVYIQKERWNDALYNFKIALQIPPSESATHYNPLVYTRDIYSAIGTCYLHLGQLENSRKAFVIALKADPKNTDIRAVLEFVKQEIAKYALGQKYVEIAKALDKPEKIQQLLATIPAALQDNEMILGLRNNFDTPKTWKDKSIAVYCGSSAETWNPNSLINGIGGSETAVIELTKRLVKQGYEVTVFAQCDAPPEGLEFDGVKWENYWKFNLNDEFNILWIWRIPEMFDYKLNAKFKFLDLHDTMTPADFFEKRLDNIDKIFVKTHFHRSLYPAIPDEKFVVINNGIDLTRFATPMVKNRNRFLYTSSPNRGLEVLLKMWPKIKEKLPEAELHVYYGWDTFYKLEKNNPERMMWMKKMQGLMEQGGVINHGRLGQKELAIEMLKSAFWLYPTDFPEISCITAMEMQAAGVLPITTGYGALAETQVVGIKVPGDIYDPTWQDEYIGKVIESTEIFYPMVEIQKAAEQFNWDKVTDRWIESICV